MGKATGVFLILAGVGTAALVLPAVDRESERQLVDVVRIATGGTATSLKPAQVVPRTATAAQPNAQTNAASAVDIPAQVAPARVAAAVAPSQVAAPSTTITPPSAASVAPMPRMEVAQPILIAPPQPAVRNANVTALRNDDGQAKQQLARDIQKELKRVGCYDGDVTGDWNAGTRRAMKLFIDKVNAALPSDEPDHILRTMVQGHPGNACGRTPAVVAQAPKMPARPVDRAQEKLIDRVAEAAPREVATARPTVPKPAWETSVGTATVAAAIGSEAPVPAPAERGSERRQPLDTTSRMAIGGPGARDVDPTSPAVPKLIAKENGATSGTIGSVAKDIPPTKRMVTPGAIAALSQPKQDQGAAISDATGTAPTAAAPALKPAIGKSERGVRDVRESREAREARAFREEIERRQRQARRYAPPPQVFVYPSYVGVAPKYFSAQTYTGNFSARFYERQRRDGDSR